MSHFRTGPHRRAEARRGRRRALDGDDERRRAAGAVVGIDGRSVEEDVVLDLERGELARADADEGERGRVGSTPAKRTPAAVLRPTRMGVRGGNVQRFHDIGPTAWSNRLVSSRRVSRYRPGPASAPRPAGRSAALRISSRMMASSRTVGPTIVRPSARNASSNRSRSAARASVECPDRRSGRWSPRLLLRSGEEIEKLGPGGGQASGDRVEHARQDRRGDSGVRLECSP